MSRNLLFALLGLLLVACGSRGSRSSPSATGGGGTTETITNGNASHYGFMTNDGSEIVDYPVLSTTFAFSNVGAIDVWDANAGYADFMVYQPTCLSSSAGAERYSMVLVSGTGPTVNAITRTASGLTVQDYSVSGAVGRNYMPPDATYTTACDYGRTETNDHKILYANGKFAVFNSNNDVYFGVAESYLKTSGTITATGTAFTWVDSAGEKWDDSTLWGATAGSVNASASATGGVFDIGGIASTLVYLPDVGTATTTKHIALSSSGDSARGIAATIGGKTLVIGVHEPDGVGGFHAGAGSCYDDLTAPDTSYKSCNGLGSVFVFLSN